MSSYCSTTVSVIIYWLHTVFISYCRVNIQLLILYWWNQALYDTFSFHDRSVPERRLPPPPPMYPNTILAQWLSLDWAILFRAQFSFFPPHHRLLTQIFTCWCERCRLPKISRSTCYLFLSLWQQRKFKSTLFHRVFLDAKIRSAATFLKLILVKSSPKKFSDKLFKWGFC